LNKSRFFLLGAAAAILLILLVIIPHNAFAWGWGPGPGGWGAGVGNGNDGWYHQGAYQNGYYAGIQDAIYDHQNNLVYTDQPSRLSCRSQLYLDGFRHGYDQQWNSYQNQESTQGTSINIYGNNNYVNTAQNNEQYQKGPGPEANSDFNPPGCCSNCYSSSIPCGFQPELGGPNP
jgi:hypothetical protein